MPISTKLQRALATARHEHMDHPELLAHCERVAGAVANDEVTRTVALLHHVHPSRLAFVSEQSLGSRALSALSALTSRTKSARAYWFDLGTASDPHVRAVAHACLNDRLEMTEEGLADVYGQDLVTLVSWRNLFDSGNEGRVTAEGKR